MYKDYLITSEEEQTAEGGRTVWRGTHVRYNTVIAAFSEEELKKIIDNNEVEKQKATQRVDEALKKSEPIIKKMSDDERYKDKNPEKKQKTNEQLRQKYGYVGLRYKYGTYHERLMDSM